MKILVVEDDKVTAELVKGRLAANDHTVEIATDGAEGSFMGRTFDFDAILLDYSLPKKNGLQVCKEIRVSGKTTPIIFISVTDDPVTKVAALESGADDYLAKPFQLEELYARLKAVTRRSPIIKKGLITIDDLTLDTDTHFASRGSTTIHLTRKEFNLLEYMMQNIGSILSRASLMEKVWTADSNPFSNTIETHIRNIRKKITVGDRPNLIGNVPGRGYIIDTPQNLAKLHNHR